MPAEIYNDFDLKKASPLDSRLAPLALIADLPNPMTPDNFLFLGATIYVQEDNSNYRVEEDPNNPGFLIWVKQSSAGLVTGTLNITPLTTNLDLNLVSPSIELCDSVLVNIVNGTTASVQTITNFPDDVKLTFFTGVGQTLTLKHEDYTSANTGKIVIEDGFNMDLRGRTVGNESVTFEKQDTAIVQVSATQFIKSTDWVNTVLSLVVEDSLTSTSINTALSANQGKILNETKQNNLTVAPSERIDLTNDIITIKPYPKNEISITWSTLRLNSAASNTATFLADLCTPPQPPSPPFPEITTIVNEDRYVNMTPSKGLSIGQPLNFGIWMLPAGLNGSDPSNWFMIESPKDMVTQYALEQVPVGDFNDSVNALRFSRTATGNLDSYFDFDTINGITSAYSFKPKWVDSVNGTLFEIEYDCKFYSTNDAQPVFYINLVKSTDVITSSTAYPAGFSGLKAIYSPAGQFSEAGTQHYTMTVKYLIKMTTREAISCYLGSAYSTLENMSGYGGTLTIKKLS